MSQKQQEKILNYGIIGAVLLRGIFIVVGAVAIQEFQQVLLFFAAILFYSGSKILLSSDTDDDKEEDLSNNAVIKFSKLLFKTTDEFDGDKFFTKKNGVTLATPLFLCLICIELSDIVFAFDSVPAIFGVTTNPIIVYSSNIFAIAGLRSLFGVLSKAVSELVYLEKAVGIVLTVIGSKMTAEVFGYELLSPLQSLFVVICILGSGIGLSLYNRPNSDD